MSEKCIVHGIIAQPCCGTPFFERPIVESSVDQLFRKAFEKQMEVLEKTLNTVFNVTINHVNQVDFLNNWTLEIIVSLTGDILNVEKFKSYDIMQNARVSGGHIILNWINNSSSRIPLVNNYITQLHHVDVITTITVSKKKMKI